MHHFLANPGVSAERAAEANTAAICTHFRGEEFIMAVERIDPETAHDRVYSGKALLVCAYDSEEKFRENHLEGGISLFELEARKSRIPKDRETIFYCA